jgi:hypothetical protein
MSWVYQSDEVRPRRQGDADFVLGYTCTGTSYVEIMNRVAATLNVYWDTVCRNHESRVDNLKRVLGHNM